MALPLSSHRRRTSSGPMPDQLPRMQLAVDPTVVCPAMRGPTMARGGAGRSSRIGAELVTVVPSSITIRTPVTERGRSLVNVV